MFFTLCRLNWRLCKINDYALVKLVSIYVCSVCMVEITWKICVWFCVVLECLKSRIFVFPYWSLQIYVVFDIWICIVMFLGVSSKEQIMNMFFQRQNYYLLVGWWGTFENVCLWSLGVGRTFSFAFGWCVTLWCGIKILWKEDFVYVKRHWKVISGRCKDCYLEDVVLVNDCP